MGKTATLELAGVRGGQAKALDAVFQADQIKDAQGFYKESLRPRVHFTSRRGWNNDSNGLVYYKGEYHLYYQHNPYGTGWGNMHWAHAVSTDLVHWKELPIAIYPHQFGDWAFSGSAVVDYDNTAGFKTGDEDVIVAFSCRGYPPEPFLDHLESFVSRLEPAVVLVDSAASE